MGLQLQHICQVKVFLIALQFLKCDGLSCVLKRQSRSIMSCSLEKPFYVLSHWIFKQSSLWAAVFFFFQRRSHWLKIKSSKQQSWNSSILVSSPVLGFLCIADCICVVQYGSHWPYMQPVKFININNFGKSVAWSQQLRFKCSVASYG